MKKILSLLVLILMVISLFSCTKEFEFTSEILMNNITKQTSKTQTNKITIADLSMYTVDETYSNYGIVLVQDKNEKKSCWSLFINDLLFDFESNISISVLPSTGMVYVSKKSLLDDTSTLYDAYGGIVLQRQKYISMQASILFEYDSLGKAISTNNIEKVIYSYKDENDNVYTKTIYNQLEPKTRKRIEITSESNKYEGSLVKMDLKQYGLDGYYMTVLDNTFYIYKNDGKLIRRVQIPNVSSLGMVNGKIIYQNKYIVDSDNDYTYIVGNQKYKIESYSIDLLSGTVKKLHLDYEFKSIVPYNNRNNIPTLGYATVYMINGKNRSQYEINVLIDNDGNVVYESGSINLKNLYMINKDRFYDSNTKYVFNERLEPVFFVEYLDSIEPNEGWMIVRKESSGERGIIDGDGNVIVPFEYKSIYNGFVNKKTIGIHNDGNMYIIGENSKTLVVDGFGFVTKGLVYSKTYNVDTNNYTVKFLDYNNNVLREFNCVGTIKAFSSLSTVYGIYLFSSYQEKLNENHYITIDMGMN